MIKFLKTPISLLIAIIVLAFYVRLYKIENPVADWHSWRQADTASVARNFYKEGFNPFIPKYDDMSPIGANSQVNVNRYRMVEFPIYPSLIYLAYLINGGVDERLARLISIFFSLGSTVLIYLIAKRYFGTLNGILSSFIFAILPYNIYYSRVILPEPSLIFFSLGMFYFLDKWIWENTKNNFWIGFIFGVLAFLTKPMAIFFALPLIYSYFQKEKNFFPIPKQYFLVLLIVVPFILWRVWINNFPDGIPQSSWLFNGNGIRFKPSFWWWILVDRFNREILSVVGFFLFFLGLLLRPKQGENWLMHILALSSFLYLAVVATGNVQHDYYQTLIIPAIVIFTARGFEALLKGIPGFLPRIWTIPLGLLFFVLMFYFSWLEIKGLYQVNNWSIVEAGLAADKILPKEAVVIAPYGGDSAFLYQTNRPGFSIPILSVKEMVERFGVTHYVSVTKDAETQRLMKEFSILEEKESYVIIDLRSKKHKNPQIAI